MNVQRKYARSKLQTTGVNITGYGIYKNEFLPNSMKE